MCMLAAMWLRKNFIGKTGMSFLENEKKTYQKSVKTVFVMHLNTNLRHFKLICSGTELSRDAV